MPQLHYTPGEKLPVAKVKDRIEYLKAACVNQSVLDLGCYDETALIKKESGRYLFNEIDEVAKFHLGVDNSSLLPEEGITISDKSKILRGDIYNLDKMNIASYNFDVIIAGELIEHLSDTLLFLRKMKEWFPGKRLICTTPNTTALHNMVFTLVKRESAHIDHLQVYSYKTLNTLCRHAGFADWQIIPYHVKFTEMKLGAKGIKRQIVGASESIVNGIERLFPMSAGGYMVDIRL